MIKAVYDDWAEDCVRCQGDARRVMKIWRLGHYYMTTSDKVLFRKPRLVLYKGLNNYYNRLRTKNNSLNQSFFKRILNNSNDFYQNKKKIMKSKKSKDKRIVFKFNENNDKIKKKIIYNLSDSKSNIKKYEDYKISKNYNTIDINSNREKNFSIEGLTSEFDIIP